VKDIEWVHPILEEKGAGSLDHVLRLDELDENLEETFDVS